MAGYDVCINYVTHSKAADRVVAECEALGRKALAVKADVGNAQDGAELFTACDNALGPVSLLVNNAGIIGNPDRPAMVAAMSPLGRVASADDIAAGILWLASPKSSYVTGAVVPVSGGL